MGKITVGSLDISKIFCGSLPVNKIYYGNTLVYTSVRQLDPPTNLSVSGTEVTFDEVEHAEQYEVFIDGTSIGTYTPEVPIPDRALQDANSDYITDSDSDYILSAEIPQVDDPLEDGHHSYITDANGDYISTDERVIVGFTGLTNQNSALTLTDDAAEIGMWTTTTNGDYVSVSNPLDKIFPFSKIEEFTDSYGNVLVKFPKMWIKWIKNGNKIDGMKIASYKVDNTYFIPEAFRNPDDSKYVDYFALGKYEASLESGETQAHSVSGASLGIIRYWSKSNLRNKCRAYGDSTNYYNGYQMLDIWQLTIYNMLCMMYYRTSNIKSVYNPGSALSSTGTCDGVDGMNGWNTRYKTVKMLGIENPYFNMPKFVDGILVYNTTVYVTRSPLYYNDTPTSSSNINIGFTRPSTSGYVTGLGAGMTGVSGAVYPCEASGGSSSTYFGDYTYYNQFSSSYHYYLVTNAASGGLWSFNNRTTESESSGSSGGRLAYRPV